MSTRKALLTGACLLLAGCAESIPLGSECPHARPERCADAPDVSRGDEPPAEMMGSRREAGVDASRPPPPPSSSPWFDAALDAMVVPIDDDVEASAEASASGDAAAFEPTALFPPLRNGSFTVTDGFPGPLAYEPLDPLPLGSNLAAPWAACRLGFSVVESADAERGSLAGDVLPPDPPTFVESELGLTSPVMGLRQTLPTPLRSGQRYAFRVDVRASLGANVALEVWGSFFGCIQTVELARLDAISDRGWQSRCISFTAPVDVPEIVITPVAAEDTGPGARLFFDHMRADPTCE